MLFKRWSEQPFVMRHTTEKDYWETWERSQRTTNIVYIALLVIGVIVLLLHLKFIFW
jgi:hypothetical protein